MSRNQTASKRSKPNRSQYARVPDQDSVLPGGGAVGGGVQGGYGTATGSSNPAATGSAGGGGGGGTGTGGPASVAAAAAAASAAAGSARGKPKQPNRTTKTAQKLTLFPEDGPVTQPAQYTEDMLVPEAEDLYQQLTNIPPERIGKLDRKKLPRVTAYCVANAYRLDALIAALVLRPTISQPRKFDECVYVAMHSAVGQAVPQPANTSADAAMLHGGVNGGSGGGNNSGGMLGFPGPVPGPGAMGQIPHVVVPNPFQHPHQRAFVPATAAVNGGPTMLPTEPSLDVIETYRAHSEAMGSIQSNMGEVFIFDYGVVVFWGFTEDEERALIRQFDPYQEESLHPDDVETEEFVFHYNSSYQPRVYNDVISLRNPQNYMAKLTISHAVAQSVKLSNFESLMEETISATRHIPQTMALTGKVPLSRTAITKKIGQLFIMRINVNLISPIIDTPEIFWAEPALEPLYQAIRSYLELNQRIELLNQRVAVISDLLDMLKEHLTSTHGEQLEWIVIGTLFFCITWTETNASLSSLTRRLVRSAHRIRNRDWSHYDLV
ncbi:hypothetical protein BC828DRAFT_11054 [Blastocladiella britannica]|nr:hypothetical protein BC828DRAFT_11054 [Blastocladiella britannica]